jgi:hypothetical protein
MFQSVRGARKELSFIVRELDSLKKGLMSLPPEAKTYPQMVEILRNCNSVLREIKISLRKHKKSGLRTGLQWAMDGKDGMVALRSSLEAHKTSIITLLGVLNM